MEHATTEVDVSAARALELDWFAAWRSGDPDRVLALLTDDVEWVDDFWPAPVRGHLEARSLIEANMRAVPDQHIEMIEGPYILPGTAKVAVRWRTRATNSGPIDPPGLPPTFRRIEVEGVGFHEHRHGKIAWLREIYDTGESARQLGLLPSPEGRLGRSLIRLQGLGIRARTLSHRTGRRSS